MSAWPQLEVRRATRTGFVPAAAQLRSWAAAALGARARGAELALLVVGRARSRTLNRQFRGRDRATNVLSFPAPAFPVAPLAAAGRAAPPRPLGDIVICPDVLRREAREQGKRERDHWMHLFIHGVLHLVGHDHIQEGEAQRMERLERRLLRRFGVADPYRSRA
jgi:probable rRNA maturation factor